MTWRVRQGSAKAGGDRGRGRVWKAVAVGGVALLVAWGLGIVPGMRPQAQGTAAGAAPTAEEEKAAGAFATVVLADTEAVWGGIFESQVGQSYQPPGLVLFSESTASPCSDAMGTILTGPFYCPLSRHVYLDTAFLAEVRASPGKGADSAATCVIAHEVSHHVQNELGILGETRKAQDRLSGTEREALSIRVELQADCFSGIWARHSATPTGAVEPSDMAAALVAAKEAGEHMLARCADRVQPPHAFSRGSIEQRQRWFATGFEAGLLDACDTFTAGQI
ncbi:neutral zinc metallopeptidase [Tropicimonas sp. IMCC6043]|uniref:neutral zinc metallopeptidase n=1 Tax=Tropicimonas sp. IMCC6043 TaxID=2510645 RepID=UPI00101D0DD3|nr:neutral zinc metallopeptidase [Tropicimonas sp. IMCC6043]RYH09717.1 hypothetical protein EU800_10760 [Tropicimonas sp. IMCC6043]